MDTISFNNRINKTNILTIEVDSDTLLEVNHIECEKCEVIYGIWRVAYITIERFDEKPTIDYWQLCDKIDSKGIIEQNKLNIEKAVIEFYGY